jgi:ABC-type phosphate/phosphonate transport system permease subunit
MNEKNKFKWQSHALLACIALFLGFAISQSIGNNSDDFLGYNHMLRKFFISFSLIFSICYMLSAILLSNKIQNTLANIIASIAIAATLAFPLCFIFM